MYAMVTVTLVFSYHRLFGLSELDIPVVLFELGLCCTIGLSDIQLFDLHNVRARSMKSQAVLHRTDEAEYLLGHRTKTSDVVLSQQSAFPQGNNGLDAQFNFRPV